MPRTWTFLAAAFLAWAGVAAADDAPAASYSKDVKPFLNKYCMNCHNDSKPKAGYSVETLADLTKDGRKGALVIPADPDDSRLLLALAGKGKRMPPGRSPQPRSDEINKVHDWIAAGAKGDAVDAADDKKNPPADAGK